jgi:hypothetical protein
MESVSCGAHGDSTGQSGGGAVSAAARRGAAGARDTWLPAPRSTEGRKQGKRNGAGGRAARRGAHRERGGHVDALRHERLDRVRDLVGPDAAVVVAVEPCERRGGGGALQEEGQVVDGDVLPLGGGEGISGSKAARGGGQLGCQRRRQAKGAAGREGRAAPCHASAKSRPRPPVGVAADVEEHAVGELARVGFLGRRLLVGLARVPGGGVRGAGQAGGGVVRGLTAGPPGPGEGRATPRLAAAAAQAPAHPTC